MTVSACPHTERVDGICRACGDCLHELVLNGACYYCGTTELDPVAMSPKPLPPQLIEPARLVRKKP